VGFGFLGEDFTDFAFVLVTWDCLMAFVTYSTGLAELLPELSSHFVL
jgi:hypothetical protein